MHLTSTPLPLSGAYLIDRRPIGDARGFFSRLFCSDELSSVGWRGPVMQINHTLTIDVGTIRGMHLQRGVHAETKFVSCLAGSVFDVAIDLRPESPTYMKWHGEILSAENMRSMLIPRGFAHGFQTLVKNCELLYLHDRNYHKDAEGGVNALDARIGINWPLPPGEMSDRDRALSAE